MSKVLISESTRCFLEKECNLNIDEMTDEEILKEASRDNSLSVRKLKDGSVKIQQILKG